MKKKYHMIAWTGVGVVGQQVERRQRLIDLDGGKEEEEEGLDK